MVITKIRDIPARNYFNCILPSGSGAMKCLKVPSARLWNSLWHKSRILPVRGALLDDNEMESRHARDSPVLPKPQPRLTAPSTRGKFARLKKDLLLPPARNRKRAVYQRISTRIEEGGRKKRGTVRDTRHVPGGVYKVTGTGRERKSAPSLAVPLFRSGSIIRRCTKETDGIVTRRVVTHSRVADEIH